jgi:Holliday junction resolvasome RuvABC ATP-dependent DNA helicase subunit
MRIIGQNRLINEINFLLKSMVNGENYNILLTAGSGYGKTTLALNIMYHLGWEKTGEYLLGTIFESIDKDKRVHVIDEAHTLKIPELLYPEMDSKEYVFILCSNLGGYLPEPLRNRCLSYSFDRYTKEDVKQIIEFYLKKSETYPNEFLDIITERSSANPREIKNLCTRLSVYLSWNPMPNNKKELIELLDKLGIKEDGLTFEDELYLEILKTLGKASISTMSAITHLDINTIKFDIEPKLLYLQRIKISPRGREYVALE